MIAQLREVMLLVVGVWLFVVVLKVVRLRRFGVRKPLLIELAIAAAAFAATIAAKPLV